MKAIHVLTINIAQAALKLNNIQLLVIKLIYSARNRSSACLLIPKLLASPIYYRLWYQFCRINGSVSRISIPAPSHCKKWWRVQMNAHVSLNKFSTPSVNTGNWNDIVAKFTSQRFDKARRWRHIHRSHTGISIIKEQNAKLLYKHPHCPLPIMNMNNYESYKRAILIMPPLNERRCSTQGLGFGSYTAQCTLVIKIWMGWMDMLLKNCYTTMKRVFRSDDNRKSHSSELFWHIRWA